MKTISSLADPRDGRDLEHPPKVPSFGANAKQVEFWLGGAESSTKPPGTKDAGDSEKSRSKGKGRGKGKGRAVNTTGANAGDTKPLGNLPSNQYISVFDFFLLGTQDILNVPETKLIHDSIQHQFGPVSATSHERWYEAEPYLPATRGLYHPSWPELIVEIGASPNGSNDKVRRSQTE